MVASSTSGCLSSRQLSTRESTTPRSTVTAGGRHAASTRARRLQKRGPPPAPTHPPVGGLPGRDQQGPQAKPTPALGHPDMAPPQACNWALFKEKQRLSPHVDHKGRTAALEAPTPPPDSARDWEHTGSVIYLCPGAFPGTPPPPQSRRRCFATFFLAAEESPTSEGLQTKRFWSLAEEKLAGFQCSWQTLGGLHFSICRREQRCVCLHRSMAPPPAQRHYGRGWALESVRLAARCECKCYVTHYQM